MEIDDDLLPLIQASWLPRNVSTAVSGSPATVRISATPATHSNPAIRPTLKLGDATLWISDDAAWGALACGDGSQGLLDFSRMVARLSPSTTPGAPADLYSMLTISAALLLGRLGQALVHAAAVVAPDGTAWLLIGDARSGKSTTTVNLVTRGWNYLSDDQVVLRRGTSGEPIEVSGLLRPFHLDEGWGESQPVQRRRSVDSLTLGPGQLLPGARLGRLLFPRVSAAEPTVTSVMPASEAMAGLVRQSPWLLADRVAAPGLLDLLRSAANAPASTVRLGLDTFGNAERLETVLLGGAT